MELLINQIKALYRSATNLSAEALSAVYATDVVFVDPVHRVEGLVALQDYFDKAYSGVNSCQFHFTDEMTRENTAVLRWEMHMSHRSLASGELVKLRGISWLVADAEAAGKIVYHEDYYDLGALVYENIPVLGRIVNSVKTRLAK